MSMKCVDCGGMLVFGQSLDECKMTTFNKHGRSMSIERRCLDCSDQFSAAMWDDETMGNYLHKVRRLHRYIWPQ